MGSILPIWMVPQTIRQNASTSSKNKLSTKTRRALWKVFIVTDRQRVSQRGEEPIWREPKKRAYRKRLGKSSFCSYREGSKDNPLLFWDVSRPQWVNSSDLIGGMIL